MVIATVTGCAATPPVIVESTVSEPKPAPRVAGPVVDQQRQCLALAMYWEARGEGRRGMLAVGSVVLNRVADQRFPSSVCGVVQQGGETPPCQFSWWCDGKSDRPVHRAAWNASLELAGAILAARPSDPTGGALFFHNTSIKKPWRRTQTAQVGNHIFYR